MTPLPDASPRMRADFLQWLKSFAGYVRAVNYKSAIALFPFPR